MDRAPESPKSAPETPKPRRHYALTGKAREARLVSLAKAREKARCALRGYRRGPQEDDLAYESRLARQIKPWCANLRRAIGAKKADRSAHYASHFTHGLTAPDLDRSAAAAGEDPDELRRHIERCQGAIGGLIGDCRLKIDDCQNRGSGFGARDSVGADSNPEHRNPNPEPTDRQSSPSSTGNRQSKLVLALAYVLWRALRLMRTQVRWERRAFVSPSAIRTSLCILPERTAEGAGAPVPAARHSATAGETRPATALRPAPGPGDARPPAATCWNSSAAPGRAARRIGGCA